MRAIALVVCSLALGVGLAGGSSGAQARSLDAVLTPTNPILPKAKVGQFPDYLVRFRVTVDGEVSRVFGCDTTKLGRPDLPQFNDCDKLPPGLRNVVLAGDTDPGCPGCPAPIWSLSGRPTKAGTYTFRIAASDGAGGLIVREYTLVVEEAPSEETRIETASFAFEERAKRREAALKDKAFALAKRKDDLEENLLPAAKARVDRALEAENALAPQIAEVTRLLDATRKSLEQLRRAEGEAPEELKGLLRAESAAVNRIATLESQILAKSGDVAAAAQERERARKGLRGVEKEIAARFAGSPLGDLHGQWVASLRSLEDVLSKLQAARAAAQDERVRAETDVSKALEERAKVDADLVDVVSRLAGFEPAVEDVTVEAGGKRVFHAASSVPYAKILQANREIAAAQRAVTEVDAARSPIRANFFSATREAIASEQALAKLLNHLAWARFATDLGFDVWDILNAASKGGIVGALAEFGKKIADRYVIPALYPREPDQGFAPGSIEEQVNREFKAGLKDAWSKESVIRVGTDRVIKEGGTKVVKVTAQKWTVEALEKLGYSWQQRVVGGSFTPANSDKLYEAGRELRKINNRVTELKKGISGISIKGVAENVVKDLLKTGLKGAYDLAERNAWIDFFEKEATMRALSPLYFQAVTKYWEAYEDLENRLAAKAKLLGGLDPNSGLRTTLSTKFKTTNTTLTITVKVAPHSGPDDLEVIVGNDSARAVSVKKTAEAHTLTFRASAKGAGPTLTLLLR